MPKHQSSLDSFFGVSNSNKKKGKKQKTMTSFFEKQNKENDDNNDVLNDERKEEEKQTKKLEIETPNKHMEQNEVPVANDKRLQKQRRRLVIEEDDDDTDDVGDDNDTSDVNQPTMNSDTGKEELESTTATLVAEIRVDSENTTTTKADVKDEKQIMNKTNSSEKPTSFTKFTTTKTSLNTTTEIKEMTSQSSSSAKETSIEETDDLLVDTPPGRKQLVVRAKKLAKAFKVEPIIQEPVSSPVLYVELVKVFDRIQAISSRLEIQAIFTKFLRQVLQFSPQDLIPLMYLATNSVAPAYQCVELGVGDSLLISAIAEAYGSNDKTIKGRYETSGDLGTVAQTAKSSQRTLQGFGLKRNPLTLKQVLQVFREIASITGNQSRRYKIDKIKKLLVAVQDSAETKYIIRGLQSRLRIGLQLATILTSLAHALSMTIPATVLVAQNDNIQNEPHDDDEHEDDDEPDDSIVAALKDESLPVEKTLEAASNMVRRTYSEVPSFDALLDAALKVPLVDLHKACNFQPGIPVEPMLAKPTKSIQELLKRLDGQQFTCEYKYDGERAQIHKTTDGTLKVFSRNLLETTGKYPEVPQYVQEAAEAALSNIKTNTDGESNNQTAIITTTTVVDSFVLDAEVVAFNRETGQLVPFQILSTRKKTEESAETAKVQVIVQAFDLMYWNGKSLLSKTLRERRTLLHQHFAPVDGKFQFAKAMDHVENGDTIVLEQFLDTAVKGQCEGLMVKTMDDVYEPSRRSLNWLKLKKDYLDGLGDSFDLVPIGAYHGKGKRTGVYGAYLLACYDEDNEEYQSVCKIGTGFSDEDLQTLSANLNKHKLLEGVKASNYVVTDVLKCDVWFDAVQVWEVKAADLSKSSVHRGAFGKLEEGRGIGLRFPRFERIRDDKGPEQATSSDQILELYYNQDTVKGQQNNDMDDDGI